MRRFVLAVCTTWLLSPIAPASAQSETFPGAGDAAASPERRPVVEGEDFVVYDGRGHVRSFAHVLEALDGVDVVLVGESHTDEVGHGMEAELLAQAARRVADDSTGEARGVVLSLEMFERDVQPVVDEYLAGLITEEAFLAAARPWERYATDYRALVEFARDEGLPVVAANAPQRYVNRVARLGPGSLQDLPAEARTHLPPLPYPGPSDAYRAEWNEVMAGMFADGGGEDGAGEGGAAAPHDMAFALDAQALWDAAMGESVARVLEAEPDALVLHFAGAFHVARGTGIAERLADYRPGTRVLSVVLEPTEDIRDWQDDDHAGLADFVVLTRR